MTALVTPSHKLTIGSKTFSLDGSFATLRAIQEHFEKDLLDILSGVMHFHSSEIADLIAIGINDLSKSGEIGQAIADDVGLLTHDYSMLKARLTTWLHVAMTPKADREKKSAELQEKLGKSAVSLGTTINSSPSVPSDGSQVNSGEATSGN
jgi:hypothetical protein